MQKIKWRIVATFPQIEKAMLSDYDSQYTVFADMVEETDKQYDVEIVAWKKCHKVARVRATFPTRLAAVRWANQVMRDWVRPISESRETMAKFQKGTLGMDRLNQ